MQTPGEFVREQVSTVRGRVDRVTGSVAAMRSETARPDSGRSDSERSVSERPDQTTSVSATASQVGTFIREQRSAARVSLRELARVAGVSNPYLSQVERGLRKPSAEILAAIARGLSISAETLYEQAGILSRRAGNPDTLAAIRSDEALSERHKAVLLELYETYVREHAQSASGRPSAGPHPTRPSKESA